MAGLRFEAGSMVSIPAQELLDQLGKRNVHSVMLTVTLFGFKSRVGAVALYTVLWTVVVKYRKWPFSAPRRTKTL
jgi:hypothetical protein